MITIPRDRIGVANRFERVVILNHLSRESLIRYLTGEIKCLSIINRMRFHLKK